MAIILAEKFSVSFDEAKANIKELANGIAEQYAHDLAHDIARQLRRQLGGRARIAVITPKISRPQIQPMASLSRLTILKPAAKWLAKTVGKIVSIARHVSKGKGRGSTFAVTKIVSFIKSSTRAVIAAVGPFVHRRAFDHEFRVPSGGFKPKSAKAFPMQKPEGLIFRSRTYSRFGGQVIRKRGFFNKALEKTISALRG